MANDDLLKDLVDSGIDDADVESAIAKGIESLNKPHNLNFSTELSKSEINALIIVEAVGDIYNDRVRKKIAKLYKELKISYQRKGRKEIIEVVKAGKSDEQMKGLIQRLRI